MNPLEKKEDDEQDDFDGFTAWMVEDSAETSDEVAELIKVPGLGTKNILTI